MQLLYRKLKFRRSISVTVSFRSRGGKLDFKIYSDHRRKSLLDSVSIHFWAMTLQLLMFA